MRGRDRLKSALRQGRGVFGCFANLAAPVAAELAGLAGYDFVLIDGEHGPGGHGEHRMMVQAVAASGAASLIRPEANDAAAIKRAVDLGVDGILVPTVESAAEARAAVAAALYPPQGIRSCAAPLIRAAGYGLRTQAYMDGVAAGDLLIAMLVETVEGAAHADAIAAVEGVDAIFVGPYDIAATLGLPGQVDHPQVHEKVAAIEAAARRHGRVLGGLPYGSVTLAMLWQRGYRLLAPGSDVALLRDAMLGQLREAAALAAG